MTHVHSKIFIQNSNVMQYYNNSRSYTCLKYSTKIEDCAILLDVLYKKKCSYVLRFYIVVRTV